MVVLLTVFSIFLILGGLQIASATGQTNPETSTQAPPITQEQAIQIALQKAQTPNSTPFFGCLIVYSVDPKPSNVTFYSFGVYPKWLITFNVLFSAPTTHGSGYIQVQVAADTGEIDNTNFNAAPNDEATTPPLPSQNPTATPSPTPTQTPTQVPTPTATPTPFPTPTATPSPKENFSNSAITLILVAALVVLIAGATLAFRFRRIKQTE